MYKVLKAICSGATVIAAIVVLVYTSYKGTITQDIYNKMIIALLIAIAFTGVVESVGQDSFLNKLNKETNDEIKKKLTEFNISLNTQISTISDCQTFEFNNGHDWAEYMDNMVKEGVHSIDTASLDSSVRSKSSIDHNRIWDHLLNTAKNPNINFRHIIRIRKNNINNLLDRISSGSIKEKSYYSYYDLPQEFSFTTFGIIDNLYVSLRSPYEDGVAPKYYIIKNKYVADIFSKWFENLWLHSSKIESIDDLERIVEKFDYNEEVLKSIKSKLEIIKKGGLIPDI